MVLTRKVIINANEMQFEDDFEEAEVRSQEYVEGQCRSLCEQAAAA